MNYENIDLEGLEKTDHDHSPYDFVSNLVSPSKLQKLLSYARRAVDDYNMIEENETVCVGVSGGKDSLTLLCILTCLSAFHPKNFKVHAITLDTGWDNVDFSKVSELCKRLNVPYTISKTNIKEVVFDIRKEANPCSLCAKMRRGALNDLALSVGSNKIALGHHCDDVMETFFLSLFYEGRISCFAPVTHMDRKNIFLIRPMIYISERDIKSFSKRENMPIVFNPCPANGNTKREDMKNFIKEKNADYKGFRERIFTAIANSKIQGWEK